MLDAFDPSGDLARDLEQADVTLQRVAEASAESPLLDPMANQLGQVPRLAVEDLFAPMEGEDLLPVQALGSDVGQGDAVDEPQLLPVELVDLAQPLPVPEVAHTPSTPSASDLSSTLSSDSLLAPPVFVDSAARVMVPEVLSQVVTAPTTPVPVAAPLQARPVVARPAPRVTPEPSLTARQVSRAPAAPAPTTSGTTSVSARGLPMPTAGTFDAAPWLTPDTLASEAGTGVSPLGPESARTGHLLLTPSSTVALEVPVEAGSSEAIGAQGTDHTRPAMSSLRTVRTATPLALHAQSTAPEVPVMPHERPLTRVDVRVTDGERVLDLGVSREAEGIAVEVRAPRDFVAEVQDMEADIDAALREDGGEGLASFDASTQDEYESADGGATPADSDASVRSADDPAAPAIDPRRILDRHA